MMVNSYNLYTLFIDHFRNVTRHGYELPPRMRSNPNVPGYNPEEEEAGVGDWEVFLRPYGRPGRVIRRVISHERYRKVKREILREEYVSGLPSDLMSSTQSMEGSQTFRSRSTLGTPSPIGSIQSLDMQSPTGLDMSLSGSGAQGGHFSQESSTGIHFPPDYTQGEGVQQADVNPTGPQFPPDLTPEQLIYGPHMQNYGQTSTAGIENPTPEQSVATDPTAQSFALPDPITEPRPQKMSKFRKQILKEQQERLSQTLPMDPLGQSIVSGLDTIEKQTDQKRQQE